MSSTTFAVTTPSRDVAKTIEHCIEEALRAVAGANTTVSVTLTDVTSLMITVDGNNDKANDLIGERWTTVRVEYPLDWGRES